MKGIIKSEFGNIVRVLRRNKKMTSKRLARLCGISHSYIRRIEVGICPPPVEDKIKRMADYLRINPDFLLKVAGKIDPELHNIILDNEEAPKFLREKYKR